MTQFKEKVLAPGSALNPLLALAEMGTTPAEIKAYVIAKFSPYFRNRGILEGLAIDVLAPEVVNLVRVSADSWAEPSFFHVLELYRRAESADAEASYRLCAESEPSVAASLSLYWSSLYLEQPKGGLDIQEFQYEAFRNLGFIIEACLQPLLRDLLAQVRIGLGKVTRLSDIESLSLGRIVGELYETAGYPELFAPSPWGISLSQWRNMAQHFQAAVRGDVIKGYYGEPPNQREVNLTRDGLMQVLLRAAAALGAVRLARKVFFVDNISKIEPFMPPIEVREEPQYFSFVASVATQGFKVVDLATTDETVSMVIVDLLETTKVRLVHASQLLLPLWSVLRRNSLEIQYRDKMGQPRMTFRTTGDACLHFNSGEIDLTTYLALVEFVDKK